MRLGSRYIVFLFCALISLGVAAEVRADAWCTPTGGGAPVLIDAAGLAGQTCNGDLEIRNISPSVLTGASTLTVTGNLTFTAGATLQVVDTPAAAVINIGGNLTLPVGASIDGRGSLATAAMPDQPAGTGGKGADGTTDCGGAGGGHGGKGGNGYFINGGLAYGLAASPQLPGSSGGTGRVGTVLTNAGGKGGAALRINVGGLATIDGLITVAGGPGSRTTKGSGGGGGGGGLLFSTLDLATTVTGVHFSAVGGAGGAGTGSACSVAGGGGGGRIAIYYDGVNGGAFGLPVDTTHMSCLGGPKGTGSPTTALIRNGDPGTCLVGPATPTPVITSVSASAIGQGATNVPLTVTGSGFVSGSTLSILDPLTGLPATGVTIGSQVVVPPNRFDLVVSVDYTADVTAGANPKLLRVTNPDLKTSADVALLTMTAAPVISGITQGGQPLVGLPRGFIGTLLIAGSNFQSGAGVTFNPPAVTVTGPVVVDTLAQTVSVPVSISQTAVAGAVSVSVVNPDSGVPQAPASFNILSQPTISQVTPDQLTVGQGPVTLTVDGSGFIAAAQVMTDNTGLNVVPGSTRFVSFNRLTVQVTVDVETNLAVSNTRNLWVDNGDGGVSAPVAFQLNPAQGVNEADLLYGEAGTLNPLYRYWNGFGWSTVKTIGTPIPHTPEWLISRSGLVSGSLLTASVGAARDLYLQERTVAGTVLTWQAPVGPLTIAPGGKRAMDAAAISGAAGERFLAVYATAGGGLSYRVLGATPATGTVPQTAAACSTVDDILWARLAANAAGTEAVLTYAKANEALCAIVWRNGAFDAATETVLAGAATLSSITEMAFDATYWGTTTAQAMVVWGVKGVNQPAAGYWNGTAWSTGSALTAVTTALEEIAAVRLAASPVSDRVALVNSTNAGTLLAQYWDGTGWGVTFQDLPFPLISSPDALSSLNGSRPFDVAWSSTVEQAHVVLGKAAGASPVLPVEPQTRSWTPQGGWSLPQTLPGSGTRQEARWIQLTADPFSGDLLAAVVDMAAASPGTATLNLYQWNGLGWNVNSPVGTNVPEAGEAVGIDYHFAPSPSSPTVTSVVYNGATPAVLGSSSSSQLLTVNGTGFLNEPVVQFGDPGITVESVGFNSSTRLSVTVSVAASVAPNTYGISVVNPGGATALLSQGLDVVAGPSAIRVVELAAVPCVPTAGATNATACGLQDRTITVEVRGSGIVNGATVSFAGSGTDAVGPFVFSQDAGTGEGVLTGTVQIAGNATPGVMDVTVVNPDSSTGVGIGVFEVQTFIAVDLVDPISIGAGAQNVTFTLTGRNFQPGLVVDLGAGVLVRATSVISSTRALVTADIQPTATPGGRTVSVGNLDGGSFTSAAALYTVLDGVTVTSMTPREGTQGTTVPIHIVGTGLATVNTVAEIVFSGTGLTVANPVAAANGTTLDFDLIIAQDAPFGAARDLTLTRDNGAQGIVTGAFTVQPTPVIGSITPNIVTSGEQGVTLVITGTGFDSNAVVTADAGIVIATQSVISNTRIDVTVDVVAAPGSVNLFVANPNGTVSAPSAVSIVAASPLAVSAGTVTVSAANTLSYSSISVTGGELRIVGDITVNVTNDVTVTGGAIVFDPDQAYGRLKVGGNLLVGAAGTINADGTGYSGGIYNANGAGPGGGLKGFFGKTAAGGEGGGYGGRGGPGGASVGGATYDMLGPCTPPACFDGMPITMGSGGGSGYNRTASPTDLWRPGGNGGGALVLDVAGNVTIDGLISANGTNGSTNVFYADGSPGISTTQGLGSGGGSGGSVLVLAGGSLAGTAGAQVRAIGGNASAQAVSNDNQNGTGGGGGRVMLYHGGANTFAGTLDCSGGTSPAIAGGYLGLTGTCLTSTLTTITSVTPAAVARGGSIQATIQGAGLLVGDQVLFTEASLTGGTISQPAANLEVPISATAQAPLGTHDLVVRHVDQTGGIAFGGMVVAENPSIVSIAPTHLPAGATAAVVDVTGSLFNPVGVQVAFLRGGVPSTVTATVNQAASGPALLRLSVTIPAGAPTGGYDLQVINANGGKTVARNIFTVTSAAGNAPALASISPAIVPDEIVAFPVTLFGYDFGLPAAFTLPVLSSSDPNVVFSLDPAGCPGPGNEATACTATAGVLQHIDALVTTTGATPGTEVDVTVTQGAASSTLLRAVTISPAPVISAVVPDAGVGNFSLVVSGTGLAADAVISVDDVNVLVGSTTRVGNDLVAAVSVPVDLPTTTSNVRVTNPDGGQSIFPWVINPTPIVSSLSPINSVTAGLSATIDVVGRYFHPSATVSMGAGVTVSAPTFISSDRLQVVVTVAENATPGVRTVSVSNHPTRVAGELVDGFVVARKLLLSAITPSSIGVGAGTNLVNISNSAGIVSKPAGWGISIAGQEFSPSMTLGNISFSQNGIDLLNRGYDVYSPSDSFVNSRLTGYRAVSVPGGAKFTSAQFIVRVNPTADVGAGTLTISNPDGSTSSRPFTVNPSPVVTLVEPNSVTRGEVVDLVVRGFNFDQVSPRVCFGDSCGFDSGSAQVHVLSVRPQHPNRIDVTVVVDALAPLGPTAVKVKNPDGGRVTRSGAINVVSGFSINAGQEFALAPGAGSGPKVLNGSGFSSTPASPKIAFLLADGSVDTNITATVGAGVTATTIPYSVTVAAAAAAGERTLRVINGDGATLELSGFLLVTNATGPTVGSISIPDGAGFRSANVGLGGWFNRTITGARLNGSGFTGGIQSITFDLPGVTAGNIVVVNDTTATFDLTLAMTTAPGSAGVTVVTAAGSDTRAGVLTVNAAPVVTSLQPGTVSPGAQNLSLLVSGGGFAEGVLAAITGGTGVTLRDFDPLSAGTQVSRLSDRLVRMVVDVDVSATGTVFAELTNPDGGVGRAPLTVGADHFGTPAKLAYLSGIGPDGLHIRDWVGGAPIQPPLVSDPVTPGNLPHAGIQQDLWTHIRSNPMNPGEYLMAIGEARTSTVVKSGVKLYRQLPGSPAWTQVDLIGATSSVTTQAFDLAYEQAGPGRALVVYGVGGTLWSKQINAAGVVTTAPVSVGGVSPAATGNPQWVSLAPQPGTQRILVMYSTNSRQIQALIWDGAANGGAGAFVSQYSGVAGSPLTTNGPLPLVSWDTPRRGFDGAWESRSGRAVAFWGEATDVSLRAVTWDPTAGWGTPTVSVALNTGTGPSIVEAEADPNSDRIGILASMPRSGQRAIQSFFYNNGWDPVATLLNTSSAEANNARVVAARNFDLAWDDQGRLVALYTTKFISAASIGIVSKLDYRTWDPVNGWTIAVELPQLRPTGGASGSQLVLVFVELTEDPETGDILAMAVDEGGIETLPQAQALITHMFRWNGRGWVDSTRLDDQMGHWTFLAAGSGKVGLLYGATASIAYQTDNLPPSPVVLSQFGPPTATGATISWVAPGDNGGVGQAGGYDIRWSPLVIVDDATVADCNNPPAFQVCFSRANQVTNPPLPSAAGLSDTVTIDFGAPGTYRVAVKTGDRESLVDGATGAITLRRNVSAISNVLNVTTTGADPIPPEAVTDLAVTPGANPESMAVLTWTGVGDDGDLSTTAPVLGYDLRINAQQGIGEVGSVVNFTIPFDQVTRSELVAPATGLGGVTRGVANSFTVTGLDPGTTYYFAVKGLDEDTTQYAPISNVVSLTTNTVIPTAVNDLIVSETGTNDITLAWTARGGGPTSYDLRYALKTIVDDAAVADCNNPPVGQVCLSNTARVLNTPAPAADGVRQSVTIQGLAPATTYHMALVPVRYETIAGVLTRLAPALANASATTLTDSGASQVKPTAVDDLSLVGGSVRTHEAALSWTAPQSPGLRASRYELLWSTQPLATSPASEIHTVWVPLLPAVVGVRQEHTLTGLPENAVVYVSLRSYSAAGTASALSNEVAIHTALRSGLNAISVPGSLVNSDINANLATIMGTCPSNGTPTTGSGPVGACANGETPQVTAFRWDPTVGASGDFVAVNTGDAIADPLVPGEGIYALAAGTQTVLDVTGFDLPSFGDVAIPAASPVLISNPYQTPVAVANVRIIGRDAGGAVVYDQPYPVAAAAGIVNTNLEFFTEVNGVLTRVPVTTAEYLLPYRAYFVQLGGAPVAGVNYFVEVPHP